MERPINEPTLDYAPGSPERREIERKLYELRGRVIEIPVMGGGREYHTSETIDIVMPHDHGHVIAKAHLANRDIIEEIVSKALEAKLDFLEYPLEERASIFLKAADLASGPWRSTLNAATMLGISKTVHQAEIDSACEVIDLLRFNVFYMSEIYRMQPLESKGTFNRLEYRPLDGFVLAISPFNFASIASNLPTAPAIMGNVVVWKPASSALYPAYFLMRLFQEAGLPKGVINFVPASGALLGDLLLNHPDLGGVHFTGSTSTMKHIWKRVGENVERYKQYPRIVAETGGKDFVFAHESADVDALVTALVRGSFEYQGQKCSAASRAYIPSSIWVSVKERMLKQVSAIKVGDPIDFTNFMGALIDKPQFDKVVSYVEHAKNSAGYEIICGGAYDGSKGYFVQPTVIVSEDPRSRLMVEEIFGPVLTVFIYDANRYGETLKICDETSPYGLTGSIFATDRNAIIKAEKALRFAAGNFYINDKPTGSMVGQQPFGGSRGSGTNDKAGFISNLMRWTSIRAIKENFAPPRDYRYPFMAQP